MKTVLMTVLAGLAWTGCAVGKDDVARWDPRMALESAVTDGKGVMWIDGRHLPLEGRMFDDVDHYYDRLPSGVTTNVNGGVRSMKHHTAGMQFRFSTTSPTLSFEWVPYNSGLSMDHMPSTGVSGIDIYTQDADGTWRYLRTGRIRADGRNQPTGRVDRVGIAPGTPVLVNLPLYNGIRSFRLGITPGSTVSALPPRKSGVVKPVVFYGTSITHGGCCSRPGLAFPSVVGRDLDVPVVNLGFSGSGKMEFEMATHLARIDASCYVLDCLWNMPEAMVAERYEPFIRELRKRRPSTPIVMAEMCDVFCRGPNGKDRFIRPLYEKLVREGWKNLVYLPKADMYVGDFEGTVDGCHPNDWGMMSMAKAFGGAVAAALAGGTTPESQGVSSKGISDWIDACERELDAVHGFVLMRHGRVVAEGSWAPYATLDVPHMLFSHSKSFTSTAIGFLVDDGKLDLDERVLDIFPDKAPANPSENLRQLRVRDLLTMNVGAKHTDAERDDAAGDWEKAFLANAVESRPGTVFRYDSGATYMLSAIVERRSGKRTMDFLKERLFDRIGIEKAWSTTSPSGTACGGWGMNMTTRELAKFGQLLLQGGLWEGKRLLSSEWVTLATSRQTWSGAIAVADEDGSDWHQGYGFQFWRCRHGFFRADGANGQLTVVMPQYDAVLSVHAGLGNMQKELDLIWQYVVPAMKAEKLPEDVAAALSLKAKCAALKLPPLVGAAAGAERFFGRTFRFAGSRHGFVSVKLTGSANDWACELVTDAGTSRFPLGNGEWKCGELVVDKGPHDPLGAVVGRGPLPIASSAKVMPDGRFQLRTWLTTGPHCIDLTFAEKDGALTVSGSLRGIGGGKLEGKAE